MPVDFEDMQITEQVINGKKERMWGNISRFLIIIYILAGGGYEIINGILSHHIQASFIFSLTSSLIFIGRIFYAFYSKATRTMWADVLGAVVMLVLSALHLIINGSIL